MRRRRLPDMRCGAGDIRRPVQHGDHGVDRHGGSADRRHHAALVRVGGAGAGVCGCGGCRRSAT